MADLGPQGGKEKPTTKSNIEGGTPKTGFSSAPKGETHTFYTPKGTPGTNSGAR